MLLLYVAGEACGEKIQEKKAVIIGGIRQWITLTGEDDKAPVLLFLHGGPGNSVISYASKFSADLQKRFVVVQWDQRESGKTARLNHSDQPLTVALMVSDAVELVEYLCQKFSKNKLYLVGHSWGGFLALLVAKASPDRLKVCVAAAPMIYQVESERKSLRWMMDQAAAGVHAEALQDLEKVKIPFENGEQLYAHRMWLQRMLQRDPPARSFVMSWAATWLPLFNEASQINLNIALPAIQCPVVFLVGSNDRQADSYLTDAYFKTVKAEKKELIWFANSGHSLNLTEPDKFQASIIALLPVTH